MTVEIAGSSAEASGKDPLSTLPALLMRNARSHGGRIAYREKARGIWRSWTWAEALEEVSALANELGRIAVGPGSRVGVIGDNRPLIYWSLLAIQSLGAAAVPIHPNASEQEIDALAGTAKLDVAVLGGDAQLKRLLSVRDRHSALRHLLLLTATEGQQPQEGVICWSRDRAGRSLAMDQLSCRAADWGLILQTSGERQAPRAVVLSQVSLVAASQMLVAALGITRRDEALAFLPISWIGDLLQFAVALQSGCALSTPESPATVASDIRQLGPTFLIASPVVYAKILADIEINMAQAGALKRRFYRWAMAQGEKAARGRTGNGSPDLAVRVGHWLSDVSMLAPLRNMAGLGRLRSACVTGSRADSALIESFNALGVVLRDLFGTTETAGCVALRPANDPSGPMRAFEGVALRLGDKQELYVKSPASGLGRLSSGDALRRFDEAGEAWVSTDDKAGLDPDGRLRWLGRIDDEIALADGTRLDPQGYEDSIAATRLVRAALVTTGSGQCPVALIFPDTSRLAPWARQRGLVASGYDAMIHHEPVRALFRELLEAVNGKLAEGGVAPEAQLHCFAFFPQAPGVDSGEMTRTGKLRRQAVLRRHAELIAGLDGKTKEGLGLKRFTPAVGDAHGA